MTDNVSTPDPVDIHVGGRMRTLRHNRNMTQTELGKALGLTFQQIQKYECGRNRVSASVLYRAAGALGVAPDWFFADLPVTGGGDVLDLKQAQSDAKLHRAAELVPAIFHLPDLPGAARRSIGAVILAIVGAGQAQVGDSEAA